MKCRQYRHCLKQLGLAQKMHLKSIDCSRFRIKWHLVCKNNLIRNTKMVIFRLLITDLNTAPVTCTNVTLEQEYIFNNKTDTYKQNKVYTVKNLEHSWTNFPSWSSCNRKIVKRFSNIWRYGWTINWRKVQPPICQILNFKANAYLLIKLTLVSKVLLVLIKKSGQN